MKTYPRDLIATANAVLSYAGAPEAAAADMEAAQSQANAAARIVGAFDALKSHVEDLDDSGLRVLAACAEQIILKQFYGKGEEALPVRDAAVAALPEDPPAAEE